jgi:hypothetical protein
MVNMEGATDGVEEVRTLPKEVRYSTGLGGQEHKAEQRIDQAA